LSGKEERNLVDLVRELESSVVAGVEVLFPVDAEELPLVLLGPLV
jgi:hypothetical protein